ncbi:MAG: right-handed parallel beta-helix repeat-containing protein, partial [Chloroflexota bacterium]|nr:right-handed parallel beta-helix repeat-containing protein [Chloroflexota bacterium]
MSKRFLFFCAMIIVLLVAVPLVQASTTIIVRQADLGTAPPVPLNQWYPTNIRAPGGAVAITTAQPRSGLGSLQFNGGGNDAKADLAYRWDPAVFPARTLGSLTALSFEWYRSSTSTNPANQAPALRLVYFDVATSAAGYLVWEEAYNGSVVPTNTWVSEDIFAGNFWMRAFGPVGGGSRTIEVYDVSLTEWISNNHNGSGSPIPSVGGTPHVLSANTLIVGIEVGVGSGWNGVYQMFVDNVSFSFGASDSFTFNFEPDPVVCSPLSRYATTSTDGHTTQYCTIEEAMFASVGADQVVHVQEGSWPAETMNRNYSDSPNLTVTTAPGADRADTVINGVRLTGSNFNGLTFDNLTFKGTAPGLADNSVNIDGDGTYANLTFSNNVFDGESVFQRRAIFGNRGWNGFTLTNNTFQNYNHDIINQGTSAYSVVFMEAQGTAYGTNYTATSNTFTNVTSINSLEAYRWKNVSISLNSVSGTSGRILVWTDGGDPLGTVSINGNTVTTTTGSGIGVFYAEGSTTLSGNTLSGMQTCVQAFGVENLSMTGNTLSNCALRGLNFNSQGGSVNAVTASVTGNTFNTMALGAQNLSTNSFVLNICSNTFNSVTTRGLANPGPIAACVVNDTHTVVDNVATVLNITANDTFTAPISTINIVTSASHGVVTVGPGTSVTYTGDNDYSGPDSFTYTITDAAGTSSAATVNITVEDCTTVCYASPTGLDTNSGLTPATAKRTIQAAIDDVSANGQVRVLPGVYSETAIDRDISNDGASATYQFGLFFDVSKPGITVMGVTAADVPITSNAGVLARVNTNATNNFGPSGIFVDAANITIQGLEIGTNSSGQNKTIEVIADNFTLQHSYVNDPDGSVYINDFSAAGDRVQAYTIDDNRFAAGATVDLASGAGLTGPVSGRVITNNTFTNSTVYNQYWPFISFNGSDTGVPWYVNSVGGAIITGNEFNHTDADVMDSAIDDQQFIRARGTYDNSQFDWESYWEDNTYNKATVALVGASGFDVRSFTYTAGSYTFNNTRRIGGEIQPEVNHAQDGDRVLINRNTIAGGPASYPEQVTVTNQDITLRGVAEADVIIVPPVTTTTVAGVIAQVTFDAGSVAQMHDLTVDGPIHDDGCAPEAVGVYVHDGASLTASGITVSDSNLGLSSLYGCQTGFGIVIGDFAGTTPGTAELTDVTVTDYQKGGILAFNTDSSVTVTNSTISAATVVQPFIAPNGVQISDGATGSITDSTISGNKCDLLSACGPISSGLSQGSGILIFDASPVTISGNTITDNDLGVYNFGNATSIDSNIFTANRYAGIYADEGIATITSNTIDGGEYGVYVYAYSATSFPSIAGDSVANLTLNTFTNTSVAISLVDEVGGDGFEPVVDANRNSIIGGTGPGSNDESFRNTTTVSQDIECNWWGDAAGPFDDNISGPGPSSSGEIYGPGDYTPWLTAASPLATAPCNGGLPVAVNDTYTVVDNVPTVLNVTSNDTFTAPLAAITIVPPLPMHGVVSVTGTPPALVVTYTGINDYSGPDSFTYKLTDVNGVSNSATVSITVQDCTTVCYISPTGSDSNSGLTPATAKLTIQAAIDDVSTNGQVRVLPGTYSETAIDRDISNDGASATYQFGLFFDVSKPGITVMGVTAGDVPITSN